MAEKKEREGRGKRGRWRASCFPRKASKLRNVTKHRVGGLALRCPLRPPEARGPQRVQQAGSTRRRAVRTQNRANVVALALRKGPNLSLALKRGGGQGGRVPLMSAGVRVLVPRAWLGDQRERRWEQSLCKEREAPSEVARRASLRNPACGWRSEKAQRGWWDSAATTDKTETGRLSDSGRQEEAAAQALTGRGSKPGLSFGSPREPCRALDRRAARPHVVRATRSPS